MRETTATAYRKHSICVTAQPGWGARLGAVLTAMLWLCACTTPQQNMAHRAQAAKLRIIQIQGDAFLHTLYFKPGSSDRPLTVFIEGDGQPWTPDGTQHRRDPRPEHALAFNLLLATAAPALYITRPCYGATHDPHCDSLVWTDARYSAQNVTSIANALTTFATTHHFQQLQLVGYSGGGTIAWLLARQMPSIKYVVTIAANLDIENWTQTAQFSPLQGSLNPTELTAPAATHLALHGLRDTVVPIATIERFNAQHPNTQWMHIPEYDHVCCWERDWPSLWPRINALLTTP